VLQKGLSLSLPPAPRPHPFSTGSENEENGSRQKLPWGFFNRECKQVWTNFLVSQRCRFVNTDHAQLFVAGWGKASTHDQAGASSDAL
jgi:hypothetical protein